MNIFIRLRVFIALTLLLTSFVIQMSYAQSSFKSKWDNGFKVESDDGNFKLKFGGRIMYDFAVFGQDNDLEQAFGEYKNGVEFRRLRFFNSGTVYSNLNYKLQIDFAGGKVSLKDAFIEISDIKGLGNIRIGNFKEPFRLEVLTSSKYITFMERSTMIALNQERNTGIILHNQTANGRLNWQAGLFRNGDDTGDDKNADSGIVFGGRIAGVLPLQSESNSEFVHLGASFSLRNPNKNVFEIESTPETHLGPKYLNTGEITNVDNSNLIGLELALVTGAFSFQSEYARAQVNLSETDVDKYSFPSYYAQVSYFLTGESRNYKFKAAYEGFDRVKPSQNFGSGGPGAWELALRYSSSDWNDQGLNAGKLSNITVGLNWYLNPVSRLMANYIFANLDEVGKANIFQMRMQIDF
ncbi:MAG: porin [Saprospiraceae bacterium]|nr:porin [Saprospiraceae bacterium]